MVENLTPGSTYKFKVTARNAVGSSAESVPVEILAAQVPDAPINLVNVPEVTSAAQVGAAALRSADFPPLQMAARAGYLKAPEEAEWAEAPKIAT